MFYKISLRNAKRNISQYLIYFITLVIAAACFYVVLAIESQDVIRFLKTFESHGVNKLLLYIQIIFAACLIIMFFLIVFANHFLIRRRKKEIGVYMMLGMKQSKVFWMLILEGMITSLLALISGLFIGIILSDFISLLSARIFEIQIIGHTFTVSRTAVLETSVGFMIIQIIAIFLQSFSVYRLELANLLYGDTKKKKLKEKTPNFCKLILITGIITLSIAYFNILKYGLLNIPFQILIISIILGFYGTMAVFYGITNLIVNFSKRKKVKYFKGLNAFTSRQIYEQVAGRYLSLGIISLLLFLSISMLSFGCSMALNNEAKKANKLNVFDLTIREYSGREKFIENILNSPEISPYVDSPTVVELGLADLDKFNFDLTDFSNKLMKENNYSKNSIYWSGYIIKGSAYDKALKLAGKEGLNLKTGEIGIYNDANFSCNYNSLEKAIKKNPIIKINNKDYKLVGQVNQTNLVTDTFITISLSFIMNDEDFNKYVDQKNINRFLSFALPKNVVEEEGKIAPTQHILDTFKSKNLDCESSLQSYSRQLFIAIASSYTLIYLGIILLLVTGTVLALQFITEIRDNKIRYQILTDIGASSIQMKKSLYKQIRLYFLLPLSVAMLSGVVAIIELSQLIAVRGFNINNILMETFFAVIILMLIYGLYYMAVRKSASKIIDLMEQRHI